MTFSELREALVVMGLGDRATLRQIKERHKALVKRYHPDTGHDGDPEMIRRVNAAYRLVLSYVNDYSYSFSESDFYEQNPEERIRAQFSNDPVWGAE